MISQTSETCPKGPQIYPQSPAVHWRVGWQHLTLVASSRQQSENPRDKYLQDVHSQIYTHWNSRRCCGVRALCWVYHCVSWGGDWDTCGDVDCSESHPSPTGTQVKELTGQARTVLHDLEELPSHTAVDGNPWFTRLFSLSSLLLLSEPYNTDTGFKNPHRPDRFRKPICRDC